MNKKHLLLTIFAITIFFVGCTDEDSITEKPYAVFLQDTISVSPLGGEVFTIVEWFGSEWEINMGSDNGFITDVSQQTGNFAKSKEYTQIKFYCDENNTETIRTQEVILFNKTNGESSKLVLKQKILDNSVLNGYCVSTTGSDEADGSRTTPFRTIGKAASMTQPGDTVFVEGGTYIEHSIKPMVSGAENAMIVFKPLSATDPVIIKHPGTSVEDLTSVFDLTDRNYIHIEGFHFKDFKYGKASIYIERGIGNVIINNKFLNLGVNEITAWNATSVIFVYRSTKNVIRNNNFDNITGDGIGVNSDSRENLISENTFINFHGMKRAWAPEGSFTSGITVQETKVGSNNIFAFNYARKGKPMIWFDRDGSDNIAIRNVGHDAQAFIFNESRCVHNVIQENIAYNISGVAFETARYETGWTADARWINNVSYNNKTGYYVHKSERDEFRNNITVNSSGHNLVFTSTASMSGPHIFKNNLWYIPDTPNSIQFEGNNISVKTFGSKIGETNGLSIDPLFVNPEGGDFRLQPSSPAKGAGDTGIDLGAYAVYPMTTVGYDNRLPLMRNLQVSFNTILSTATRGENLHITIDLNRIANQSVSVDLTPIAGDAQKDIDYNMESQTVTFNSGERRKTVILSFKGTATHDQLVAFRLENAVNTQIGPKNMHIVKVQKK